MYRKITDEDPYKVPMRIYPAIHYTMGGLWVDYNLMSTIPGLHVLGEANFSDHGANRLGASALMQGLADGYFVIPYTIGELPGRHSRCRRSRPITTRSRRRPTTVQSADRSGCWRSRAATASARSIASSARIMWDDVGMARNEAGLQPRARANPAAARGVLAERVGARARRTT